MKITNSATAVRRVWQRTILPTVTLLATLAATITGETQERPAELGAPAKLQFSAQPTEAEIFNARVFDEPLIPIGSTPRLEENQALAAALAGYANRTSLDDFSSLTDFLDRFPQSPWCGSLLLHLGVEYYNNGYYSRALDAWERAWKILRPVDDPKGKTQADRALGELIRMCSKLGRMGELSSLLDSVTNRPLSGPGTQLIHSGKEAIWLMQHQPGTSFRCGPLALENVLAQLDPAETVNAIIMQARSTTNGFSLAQLRRLSLDVGMNYQMAFRNAGAPFVAPAVVHWKVGHYAAVVRRVGDRFLVKDPTFLRSLWITATALNEESSGYFLIAPGPLPAGWRPVSETEAQSVWGRGQVSGQNPNFAGPGNVQTGGDSCGGGPPTGDPGNGNVPAPGDPNYIPKQQGHAVGAGGVRGMTTYTMNTMLASLCLNDTPVGYRPPVGPWVEFTATYNQNDANQPATFYYSNLGPDWTCNWIEYITDNPNSPGADVTSYTPGGGTLSFTGFNSASQSYQPETMTQAILTMTSSSNYVMQFRSGVTKVFGLSDGSIGSSRRIFLTQIIDPAGNAITLNYDSNLRIASIVDAIGQATVLSYGNSSYPDAITAVTDPFGRTATFQYNVAGLLTQITDVLGISSQYTYDSNELITNLVTPYGTTVFAGGITNGTTWLQATDPLGESELAEAPLNPITSTFSDPVAPVGMPLLPFNQYLNYRNTYFWDKKAFQFNGANPSTARIYHFLHDGITAIESGVLESVKMPLEKRVWYDYPGNSLANVLSSEGINRPSCEARVLDDGTTQLSLYQYNALGRATNSTDPLGRNFTYVYATNNVDLLQVLMTSNGKNELQSTTTYNSQHLPLTITDASGQTTTNTYNARGQLLSTTDPLGELTTFTYDTNGYLLSITGPLQTSNDITSFTYDGFGRVQTVTDTEGYTLTYAYDAADRVTSITHPDGTTEQFVYSNLDLIASADRLGRWTTNTYNAIRQLVQTQDPLGRLTRYQYCTCGALEALFDPAGNETRWDRDIQSRVTAKHYADGSQVTYNYEATTSRLKSVTDEKGQTKNYSYAVDDNLTSVSYSNAIVATPTVTYTYDTNYNRVLTMQDGIGATLYTYNPVTATPALGAGQLASVTGPLPNSTVAYQYDPLGRVISRAINGVAQAVTFDPLGRPTVVTNALGAFGYTYVDATPRVASESYPNGQTNLYSYYNNLGDQRLLQIQHLYPNGSLLSGFGYAYNAVGQITAWTNLWDTLPARVWFPGYDAADQLTNVVSVGGVSPVTNYVYAYDPAGNRLLATTNGVQSQFYYNPLNQLVGSSSTLTNVSYEWDAENRLTAINQRVNRSEFSYDGLGRRLEIVEKTNGVVMTNNYYLWCGRELCEERDTTGGNVESRYFAQGVSQISGSSATNYYYTRDHLDSVRELVDNFGAIRARYDYSPYGARTKLSGDVEADFGFTGHYFYAPCGVSLTLFRPYDSKIGRWLSRDPVGEAAGVVLYIYANSNPIMNVDPYGLCTLPPNDCDAKEKACHAAAQQKYLQNIAAIKEVIEAIRKGTPFYVACSLIPDSAGGLRNACDNISKNVYNSAAAPWEKALDLAAAAIQAWADATCTLQAWDCDLSTPWKY